MPNGKKRKPGVKTMVEPPKTWARRAGEWGRRGLDWLMYEEPDLQYGPGLEGLKRSLTEGLWPDVYNPAREAYGGFTGWDSAPPAGAQMPSEDDIWGRGFGYGGASGYQGGSPFDPWDVSQTKLGQRLGPQMWGRYYPTLEEQTGVMGDVSEQLGIIGQRNRARLEQMQAQQAQRMGQAAAGAGAPAGGAGAGGRAPSRPELGGLISAANESWWGEFERVHDESPREYYSRYPNRYPGATWQESANNDLAWAQRVARQQGQGPSEQQWVQHYYDVRGWYAPKEQQSFEAYNLGQQYGWK